MFKIDELKKNELFKELDDSVLNEFVRVSQEGGDKVKNKYLSQVEEANTKFENASKELETLKNDTKNKEDERGNEMDQETKDLISKQTELIEALSKKVDGMESKDALTGTRQKVLERAKEEGRDLEKVKAYIDRLGENLTEDESLDLFPKTENGSSTEGSSDEGNDDGGDTFVDTGNALFDELMKGE